MGRGGENRGVGVRRELWCDEGWVVGWGRKGELKGCIEQVGRKQARFLSYTARRQ